MDTQLLDSTSAASLPQAKNTNEKQEKIKKKSEQDDDRREKSKDRD